MYLQNSRVEVVYVMTIGERIKESRIKLNWSQRELSEKMGYSNHSTIVRIENNKVDIPYSRIIQFAEVLGVSIAYLMGWDKEEKNNNTIASIVVRLRTDSDFLSLVESLDNLDEEKVRGVKQMLTAFLK
jgi:transcriptional regulator with XRE-family HTH domain